MGAHQCGSVNDRAVCTPIGAKMGRAAARVSRQSQSAPERVRLAADLDGPLEEIGHMIAQPLDRCIVTLATAPVVPVMPVSAIIPGVPVFRPGLGPGFGALLRPCAAASLLLTVGRRLFPAILLACAPSLATPAVARRVLASVHAAVSAGILTRTVTRAAIATTL